METLPKTLRQFLPESEGGQGVEVPPGSLFLLAYNPQPATEREVACLDECAKLVARIPKTIYQAVCVPDGGCKADNLNAALAFLARKSEFYRPSIICFMDADTQFTKQNCLLNGLDEFRQQTSGEEDATTSSMRIAGVGCVCMDIDAQGGSVFVALEHMDQKFQFYGYACLLGYGWVNGTGMFLRTELALAYGFDRRCLNEDNDLGLRLAANG